MQHIGGVNSLEVLVIRGCHDVSDASMGFLTGLTRLKYFDARHCHKIHSIPTEWSQLQVLLLGYTAFAESDTAVLQHFTELQQLELRKCHIMKRYGCYREHVIDSGPKRECLRIWMFVVVSV